MLQRTLKLVNRVYLVFHTEHVNNCMHFYPLLILESNICKKQHKNLEPMKLLNEECAPVEENFRSYYLYSLAMVFLIPIIRFYAAKSTIIGIKRGTP
jgi:hypothetical protein